MGHLDTVTDPVGRVKTYSYEPTNPGQEHYLIKIELAVGACPSGTRHIEYSYQNGGEGQLLASVVEYPASGSDTRTTSFTYDASYRVIKILRTDVEGSTTYTEHIEYGDAASYTEPVDWGSHLTCGPHAVMLIACQR